jgi:hypothetical protein
MPPKNDMGMEANANGKKYFHLKKQVRLDEII